MKRILLLILLLVTLAGCAPTKTSSTGFDMSFPAYQNTVVDGVAYGMVRIHGKKDGNWYSVILIFPDTQNYYPVIGWEDKEPFGRIYQSTQNTGARYIGGALPGEERFFSTDAPKIADVVFNQIYYIDGGKVIFQKTLEESGIVFSDEDAILLNFFVNTKPLLEQLIREHVKNQKPEITHH